jgi:hypothetical protein
MECTWYGLDEIEANEKFVVMITEYQNQNVLGDYINGSVTTTVKQVVGTFYFKTLK